jgi:proline-specific peptidase
MVAPASLITTSSRSKPWRTGGGSSSTTSSAAGARIAILGFYRKHVCRLDPWPAGLERSFAEAGYDVYNTMNGPSEFTVAGSLKTWDVMERLPEIAVRTLLVGGRYDECTPGHLEEMHRGIAGSQLVIIEDASHLCFAEQPEEFNRVINSFMT